MTTAELELAIRDSLALESCKTERDLSYAIRNVEARHAVEGIDPANMSAWQNLKRQHILRIYRTATA